MTTYVFISDIHGQRERMVELLTECGLIDAERQHWIGGNAQLWILGDFFDRGPDGVGAVDLAMALQPQAIDAGGSVNALLGNHELLFLAAHRFGRSDFFTAWRRNGGQESDMARITPAHLLWLNQLPAMAHVENMLLIHADSLFYRDYGETLEQVNDEMRRILHNDNRSDWTTLLDDFSERFAFVHRRKDTASLAVGFLMRYGGEQIIHGHTPIQYVADVITPTEAFVYNDNFCVDIDGGISLGAPGFVHVVTTPDESTTL